MTTTVPLNKCTPGEPINSRVTNRQAGLGELAASILAIGLQQPLRVRRLMEGDDIVSIVDGHRRFAAIEQLVAEGKLPSDIEIPVHFGPFDGVMSDDEAREASLAANIVRVALHPIDEFEAFSKLAGLMKPSQIAERFGVSEKQVSRRIALGALHPDIRAAWRAGEIRDDVARAFTLTDDQKRQIKIFVDLKKKHQLWGDQIRIALGLNQDASKAIRLIGADAYRAAGGEITQDLFGDGCVVSDPRLAQTLAADFLKKECDRLVADGWSFAMLVEEVKDRWNWPRLNPSGKREATPDEDAELLSLSREKEALEQKSEESDDGLSDAESRRVDEIEARTEQLEQAIELRRWGARQKAKAGCFVGVSYHGDLEITFGVQNPKNAKKKDKSKQQVGDDDHHDDGDVVDERPMISNSLALALSEQLTIAASKTLSADPGLALRATVATLEQTFARGPAKLSVNGLPALRTSYAGDRERTFGMILAELLDAADDVVQGRLAIAVSKALDMRLMNGAPQSDETVALLTALDRGAFDINARLTFDAEAYFKAINAAQCNAALDEMGQCMAPNSRPKKKAELAAMCADNANHSGWLPPQLRHPKSDNAQQIIAE